MFNYIKNQLQIAKLYANIIKQKRNPYAEVVELADAPDSKSGDGDIVRVQVPPSAPVFESLALRQKIRETSISLFFYRFFLDSLFAVKVRITEIVTLARDANRLLATPSLRSLQVPPSAPNRNKTNPENSRFVFFFAKDCFGLTLNY